MSNLFFSEVNPERSKVVLNALRKLGPPAHGNRAGTSEAEPGERGPGSPEPVTHLQPRAVLRLRRGHTQTGSDGETHLYLNEAAIEMVRRALERRAGVTLAAREAATVQRVLGQMPKPRRTPP